MTGAPNGGDVPPSFDSPRTAVAPQTPALETPEDRAHYLAVVEGEGKGRRIEIAAEGVSLGREEGASLVLQGPEVSKAHCRVELKEGLAVATDLRSTNGTFIDGLRIERPTVLHVGALLQVGRFTLRHEYRSRRERQEEQEREDDLKKAADYVAALLPPPLHSGPIRADWRFVPSATLGGDAFGYFHLDEERFLVFLLDVAGRGAVAAMHSVSVINLLRGRSLPGVDFRRPGRILSKLNDLFQMIDHGGLYFSIWCGVYHLSSGSLNFSSGGHPPAILTTANRGEPRELGANNPPVGVSPGRDFVEETVAVARGGRLYLFSDGVFETAASDGRDWSYGDFKDTLLHETLADLPESDRLTQAVMDATGRSKWDDDFTVLALQFAV